MILSYGQASLTLKTIASQGSVPRLHKIPELSWFHFRLIVNGKNKLPSKVTPCIWTPAICASFTGAHSQCSPSECSSILYPSTIGWTGHQGLQGCEASAALWLGKAGPYQSEEGGVASGHILREPWGDQYTGLVSAVSLCSHWPEASRAGMEGRVHLQEKTTYVYRDTESVFALWR